MSDGDDSRAAGGSAATGIALVAIASFCFGLMGLFYRWAEPSGASTEMLLFLRFGIAGVCLGALMAARGMRWPRGRNLVALVLMGAVLYFGEAALFFSALRHISSGLVSLLLYTYPVIVTIAAWVGGKERPRRMQTVALVLAMAGLAMTIVPIVMAEGAEARERVEAPGSVEGLAAGLAPEATSAEVGVAGAREASGVEGVVSAGAGERVVSEARVRDPVLGILLGLGCAVCYSVYILVGGGPTREAGAVPASTVVIVSAALAFGTVVGWRGESLPREAWAWWGVLGLALPATVVAITCLLAGLGRIGAVRTSTLATIEPATTVAVGVLWLGEPMSGVQLLGGVCILVAAVMTARGGGGSRSGEGGA